MQQLISFGNYSANTRTESFLLFLGSGKTSFCMSLKADKAKLAEEHNMLETRFMQEFPITLLAIPDAQGKLTKAPLKHKGKILYEEV